MILFPLASQHIAMLSLWEHKNQSRLMKAIPARHLSDRSSKRGEESTISTFFSTWVAFGVPQSIFHYF